MNRKDFELIARCLAESQAKDSTINAFLLALGITCPTFDREKFLTAAVWNEEARWKWLQPKKQPQERCS